MSRQMKGLRSAIEKAGTGVKTFKIKNGGHGTIRTIISLDDVVSVFEHTLKHGDRYYTFTCIGKENGCPECNKGKYASLKTYLPVVDVSDDTVKIWKISKTLGESLVQLEDEYEGDLTKFAIKFTRSGPVDRPVYTPLSVKPAPAGDLADYISKIPNIDNMIAEKTVEVLVEEIANFYGNSGGSNDGNSDDNGNDDGGGGTGGGGNNNAGGGGQDDDYPF